MTATSDRLRVIDFGEATPLRSQTVWHAVARGVSQGAPATLSFVRPTAPYVSIGYHRSLDEVDVDYCRRHDLPVYRRMVGGGPVYLDHDQLFFQVCLPATAVPAARVRALRTLLAPAVEAFRAAGVPAVLDDHLEVSAYGAKVCGHGAGQVDDAVVVCGNVIERFDHDRATAVLALPDNRLRTEVLRLMRTHVRATPLDVDAFRAAAERGYAEALGLVAEPGTLTDHELAALDALDARFGDAGWRAGPARPRPPVTQVKVRAGVWAFAAAHGEAQVVASVHDRVVQRAWLTHPDLNGSTAAAERAVTGVPLHHVSDVLGAFGGAGRRLASAFAMADGRGCD